jgi:hypothetical protein
MFTVVRLTADQAQENITGVGAPPWTWPRRELFIDLLHKGIYGFTTGVVADRLARPEPVWVQARRDRSDPSAIGEGSVEHTPDGGPRHAVRTPALIGEWCARVTLGPEPSTCTGGARPPSCTPTD